MTVDEIVSRLENAKHSDRGWRAYCPAHESDSRSLSIAEGDDGRVLLKCWARGCTPDKITAALGLRLSDLFSGKPDSAPNAWQPKTSEERRAAEAHRLRRRLRALELENRRALFALDRAALVLGVCLHQDQDVVLDTLWRVATDTLEQRAAAAADEYARETAA